MICPECNQRPATLHFSKSTNGEKVEYHLCEQCAKEKGEMFMFNGSSGFSINNLLAGLLNMEPSFQQLKKEPIQEEHISKCEGCSMTFPQFLKIGRFGCPQCYESFKDQLQPVLRKFHLGNTEHEGKVPDRIGGNIKIQKEINLLKEKLQQLITEEEFEKAAEIRDEIRGKEKDLASLKKGGE